MKRENVKYVEINEFDNNEWQKRICIENLADGRCICVVKRDEESYINYRSYNACVWASDQWREISEPEYVPYESWKEFKERLADGWIKRKELHCPDRIISVSSREVYVAYGSEILIYTFEELFEACTWLDGTPCGKLKEVKEW